MGRRGAARPGPRRAGPRTRDGYAESPGTRPSPHRAPGPAALSSGEPDGGQTEMDPAPAWIG
jgi:hypothetical protein